MRLTGNRPSQTFIEWGINHSLRYLGVGAGSHVRSSGERAYTREVIRRCAPPYTVFDVGANQGQFLGLITSGLRRRPFQAHAFEPSRRTFEILAERHGNDEHVTLNPCGLGRKPGEYVLYTDRDGSGLASLTKRRLDHIGREMGQSERVRIDTVDAYCEKHGIARIDLLKIDVEGHELDVLAGAERMFAEERVTLAAFEFGGCNIDTRTFLQDFFYFFRERKMALYRLTPSGHLQPLPRYKELYEQFTTTNFLAVREPAR